MLLSAVAFATLYLVFLLLPSASGWRNVPEPAANARPKPGRQMLLAILAMGLFSPFLILLHEAGHYWAGRGLGLRVRFSYDEVFYFGRLASQDRFLFLLGGPMMDALVACLGLAGLLRCRHRLPGLAGVRFWVFTALSSCALRWLRVTLETVPASDESRLSAMLGAEPYVLPLALLPLGVTAAVTILLVHRRNRTLVPFGAGFVGAFFTWILWMSFLGPALFPRLGAR